MEGERVINKRILGFVAALFVILLLYVILFWFEEKGLGTALLILALIQIVFIPLTPRAYVFSRERLIIKYFFGLEENIPWQDIRAITTWYEKPGFFPSLDTYRIFYYSEEKQKFFMHGEVSKNKKTKALLKKYCAKKYDWEK